MKIVFTSCMDAERDPVQPVWNRIAAEKPDVLMLLGDQIYMDWGDLNEPKWLADLRAELPKQTRTLKRFAKAMHRRYARQWAVESFRSMLRGLPHGRGEDRLLVIWDDHDFAWNNSVGFDNPALPVPYKHGVLSEVKQVSRRLAVQFIDQLRNGVTSDARYPDMPIDLLSAADVARGLSWQGQLGGSGPECLLLDGRWARTVRSGDPAFEEPRPLEEAERDALKVEPRTLEEAQRDALKGAVAREGTGLLIVASGVPLVHDYLMSQQDWRGRPAGSASGASDKERPYMEYEDITAAKRPVLYLAGDIHRNSWGGRVPTPEPTARPSRVLQLVSSGAAIQVTVGPKIRGAYGVVELRGDAAFSSGRMSASLRMEDVDGSQVEFPRMGPDIHWNADDWQGELLGEAWDDVEAPLDTRPLLALSSRPWRKGHPVADHVSVTSTWEMDSWWSREVIRTPDPIMGADPRAAVPIDGLTLDAQGTGARVLIDRGLRSHPDQLNTQLRAAYERARARTAPLVFYIHGVGKSTHQAIRQASALRWLYGCEPVLWAWEAGNPVGLWTSIKALHDVGDSAVTGAPALAPALNALCALAPGFRERGVETIVLARSAGTMALCEALRWKGANFGGHGMAGVSRVVLSAGLLEWSDFKANDAFRYLQTPMVVTSNSNDRTLNAAEWLTKRGQVLGLAPVQPGGLGSGVTLNILDFSDAERVGRLHDYLFVPASDKVRAVNQALLANRSFDPNALMTPGPLTSAGDGIYRVA